MEDVNTRQRLSFSFLELQDSLKEFNSRKICQQLGTSLPRSRFLDVTQRENARTRERERCVTSKKRLRGRLVEDMNEME